MMIAVAMITDSRSDARGAGATLEQQTVRGTHNDNREREGGSGGNKVVCL